MRPHLEAALALWDFSEQSARFVFGASLGDREADRILAALRDAPDGQTRTQLRDLFAGHTSKGDLDRALSLLMESGLAYSETVRTDGRPAQKWFATTAHARKAPKAQEPCGDGTSRAFRASCSSADQSAGPPFPASRAPCADTPDSENEDDDEDGIVEALL